MFSCCEPHQAYSSLWAITYHEDLPWRFSYPCTT